MKKVIIVIIMVFISIGYLGAMNRKTVAPANDKTVMPSKGYLPFPAKYNYSFFKEGVTKETKKADLLDCIEGQRRIISFGRMDAGDEKAKPYKGYHSTVWVTIECMEKKGYVGTKHKIIEYPYPYNY
jgi:hypothetical protein